MRTNRTTTQYLSGLMKTECLNRHISVQQNLWQNLPYTYLRGFDTRYSFAHLAKLEKLYVFEAPIDMLSFLTLYPQDWQKHSYIAMNGVYENAVLTALKEPFKLSMKLCFASIMMRVVSGLWTGLVIF